MECSGARLLQPKVRSPLAMLAALVLVVAAPAKAGVGDAAPVPSSSSRPSASRAVPPAAPRAFDTRKTDALQIARAGDRGTALPGDDVVAASKSPLADPAGDRTSGRQPPARIDALPDPGSLQVFGLGLVIIATVAGTWRRRTDMSF